MNNDDEARKAITREFVAECHDLMQKQGFWDDGVWSFGNCVSNIHGEVSELWEAGRAGKLYDPCDKPIDLTCAEEEIADIILRALDLGHGLKIDVINAVLVKAKYNHTRSRMHGGKLC